jgi:hypothetical protein
MADDLLTIYWHHSLWTQHNPKPDLTLEQVWHYGCVQY